MTPSQLRQWSFQNSQPDQWWLSLDAVTEEIPVTVAEIEDRLKSGDYSAVQALHVSQAAMVNAPWVEVIMPLAPLAVAYRGTPPTAVPSSSTTRAPLLTVPSLPTPSQNPAAQAIGEEANITHEGPVRTWIIGGFAFLTMIYLVYLFMPFVLLTLILVIFVCVVGSVAWKHFLPKTPAAVFTSICLVVVLGTIYAGFRILLTTDLFDGESLASIVDRGKSRAGDSSARSMSGDSSGNYQITDDNFTGFVREADHRRAAEFGSDTEAFSKFFVQGVMSHSATLFKSGEIVSLEDTSGFLSGAVKVRRKGETVSYWTNVEAIRK